MAAIIDSVPKLFPIKPAVQNYAWGKLGVASAVASLFSTHTDQPVDPDKPYAELWMGTHPKGPNFLSGSEKLLSQLLTETPSLLGSCEGSGPPGQLPFLFKVLSVLKPLSIQAHPNKTLAAELHAKHPDSYPDANHKPELAIALTPFQALCGFRPLDEIRAGISETPELLVLVGDEQFEALKAAKSEEDCKSALKACFTRLFSSDTVLMKTQLATLIARLKVSTHPLKDLIISTHEHFPGDVGCFCFFFLNHLTLQPGESIFLAANEPHAYLYGDCIECMACSDNVVRAGLTPKFIDKETLCEMLSYKCRPAVENKFQSAPLPELNFVSVYDPPVPDFSVRGIHPPESVKNFSLTPLQGASILLVIDGMCILSESAGGQSLKVGKGSVVFIGGGVDVVFSEVEYLVAYQGYY